MKEKLCKLIDVKSIVTIAITGVFCFLAVKQYISAEQFLTIFVTIIAFYFGTQNAKVQVEKKGEEHAKADITHP